MRATSLVKNIFATLGFSAGLKENNSETELLQKWDQKLSKINSASELVKMLNVVVTGHVYGPETHTFVLCFNIFENSIYSGLNLSSDIVLSDVYVMLKRSLGSELRLAGGSTELRDIFKKYFSDQVQTLVLDENRCQSRVLLTFTGRQEKFSAKLQVRQHRVNLLPTEISNDDGFVHQVDRLWIDCCHFEGENKSMLTFNFCDEKMTFYSFRMVVKQQILDLKKYIDLSEFVAERYKHSGASIPFVKASFQGGLVKLLSSKHEILAQYVLVKTTTLS